MVPGFIRLFLPGVALLCITPSLYANQAGLLDMDLEQLLQVNIIGATLREESIKTVPSSTTVFTRAQLDTLGLDYLHELLNLVPGFQTSRAADSPMSYAFSIRGRRQSGQSREVLMLVDGRVFTDPRSGGIEGAMHLYPLANIEQIEIIRGPASSIYGSGAFTGVINIVSRKQINKIAVGVGENQRRAADINLAGSSGDWQTNVYAHLAEDGGQQYRIANQITHDPREEMMFDWSVQYHNTKIQAFYSEQEASDFYVLEKINNNFNNYWQAFQHLRLDQQFNPSDTWKVNIAISHEKAEQALKGMILPAGGLATNSIPASNDPFLTKGVLASEAYRFNLANDLDINQQLSAQFGVEWQRQHEIRARSYNNYDLAQWAKRQFPVTYYGNLDHGTLVGKEESRNVSGIYAQFLYQLSDKTRLTAGARHDDYQSIDTRTSPRFGLVHQINSTHTIKLLYSEAFRAPTQGETDLLNNPVLVGNPNLKSETVKSSELVWVGTWDQFSLGANVYRNYYANPISAGFNGTTRTYMNGASQKNYGAGLRMDWQLNSQWMLRGHLSSFRDLPDAYFREADRLSSLNVNYHNGRWNWNLSAIYQGERQYQLTTTQRATLDSLWYANSQLRYEISEQTSIALAVKNAFDKDYFTPAQGTGLAGGVPNRGREASINIDWQF